MKQRSAPVYQSGIYVIENTVNGKQYVGRAKHFPQRWRTHRYELNHNIHINPKLQNGWNKYGPSAFVFRVLEHVPTDETLLKARETYWAAVLRPWYNIQNIGGTRLGQVMSAETRAKLSAAKKGQKPWLGKRHTVETRAKMSLASIGRKKPSMSSETRAKYREAGKRRFGWRHTDAARAKMSEASTGNKRCVGRVLSSETRAKISAAHQGKPGHFPSEETRTKLQAAADKRKGVPISAEQRAKISATLTGRPSPMRGVPLAEETKAKISATLTGHKYPPRSAEHRAKMAVKATGNTNWLGKHHTPEQLAKMREAQQVRRQDERDKREAARALTQGTLF